MRLEDRVALVTGGGRGIGRAIALGFAREGAHVVVADQDAGSAKSVAEDIRRVGRESAAVLVDVSRRDEVEAMVEKAISAFGRLDVLVSNAGIARQRHFLEIPEDEWDLMLAVNLKGPFLCGQAVARLMRQTGGGSIINVASQRAVTPDISQAAYATSKAGVRMLTKAMALDLAPYKIRVNAIGPGPTLTDMNRERYSDPVVREQVLQRVPLGRLGEPGDMVGPAVFLASDESSWVTGHCLFVEGGWLAG